MKKQKFLFSLDLVLSKTEFVSQEELDRSLPYEDKLQKLDEDKLNLAQHEGKFVLVDRATGRIDFTEKNYDISRRAIKKFEAILSSEKEEITPMLSTP